MLHGKILSVFSDVEFLDKLLDKITLAYIAYFIFSSVPFFIILTGISDTLY